MNQENKPSNLQQPVADAGPTTSVPVVESSKILPSSQPSNPRSDTQSVAAHNPAAENTDQTANITDKPKIEMSDEAVEALLKLNGLSTSSSPKSKPPIKLLIAAAAIVIVAILTSYLLDGAAKSVNSSKSAAPANSQANDTSGDTTQQINQYVRTCSNPLKALTEC